MITLRRFRRLEAALRRQGYGSIIAWSENIQPPADADEFADRAVYVICNSGMRYTVAGPIYRRAMMALREERSATEVYGHPGKGAAIDTIWRERADLFEAYKLADDPIAFLETLPWIGIVTRHHLGKNLGLLLAKDDVHLTRLARREGTTTAKLCDRLAKQTGYRVPTIDSILWRACADGLLNSQVYEAEGWSRAISAMVTADPWMPESSDAELSSPEPLSEASAA
jgi:hypothetical protein